MNVFILNAGKCGSSSFIHACSHITNYSAGHESRATLIADERLAYRENHIEADNRLSWFLGRLDLLYGNKAFYVHLQREAKASRESFAKRQAFGIMKAYKQGILMGGENKHEVSQVAADYLLTVETNIQLFLKDKDNQMRFSLEDAKVDFAEFWSRIGAEGKLQDALHEWEIIHNAS